MGAENNEGLKQGLTNNHSLVLLSLKRISGTFCTFDTSVEVFAHVFDLKILFFLKILNFVLFVHAVSMPNLMERVHLAKLIPSTTRTMRSLLTTKPISLKLAAT